jgi:FAD/FMN-containing dehydrogenase
MQELSTTLSQVKGRVVWPADPDFDEVRRPFFGGWDRTPAVIVRAADAEDVATVIAAARATGLPLAVRSGGHSFHCLVDDGIVLDLHDMRDIDIDVQNRTAWVQAGLTAAEYTTAAEAHGLVTGFGDTGSVGLGGLVTGGGLGYLIRAFGLTIDDLLAAEVVTADGERLLTDAENHPELFWGIRGGGGNFGVVTRMKLRLHELGTVYGGLLILPTTPELVAEYMRLSLEASELLSSIVNVMPAPPIPMVPQELWGQMVTAAMLVYAGDPDDGEKAIAPFRALGEPLADMVGPMPYSAVYMMEEPDYHPTALSRTTFLDELDADKAEQIIARLRTSTSPMPACQLRPLGGAMARVPADATAFAHRDRKILATAAVVYEDPAEEETHRAWAVDFGDMLRGWSGGGSYVNFLYDDEMDRIHEAYPPATWERLVRVKQKYDPENLFKANANIPPR